MFLKRKSPFEKAYSETRKTMMQSMRVIDKMSSGRIPLEKGCGKLEKSISRWQAKIDRIGGES